MSKQSFELFNLDEDPYEKVNLVEQSPETFEKMYKLLRNWRREIGVE